jgi:glycosyltransferase involved in cell wall biosynthesis
MIISIIVPVFNEEKTILQILEKINAQKNNFDLEIIIYDDFSNDGTREILLQNKNLYKKIILGEKNLGKGYGIKQALNYISGDVVIIQDADLEYDPNDYSILLQPIINNNADIVLGSRFKGDKPQRVLYFSHRIANCIITLLVNFLTNINFTDVETGLKVFRSNSIKELNLKENSFAIEIEMIMKIAKLKKKIYEVGVSYNGRTYEEGKKIKLKDAFEAVIKVFKYKIFN